MAIMTDPVPGQLPDGDRGEMPVRAGAIGSSILRLRIGGDREASTESLLVLDDCTSAPVQEVGPGSAVQAGPFAIRRGNKAGEPLLEITFGEGTAPLLTIADARLSPVDLVRYDTNGEPPELDAVRTVDGERTFIRNLVPHHDGTALAAELHLACAPGEGLYGLGAEEDGAYNRRGSIDYLYQHNMRIPLPCLVSDAGYGILIDCGCLMTFDDTGDVTRILLDSVLAIDLYVVAGDPGAVVRGFRRLTGAAPLLPKWAFGYLQSRERYASADELVGVARRYRELGVPLDAVVQDWKTWPGDEWGQKTVDRTRYPDLAAMRKALEELNVHSMVSVWPNMAQDCPDHEEFAQAGLLLSDHSTYDAFDSRGRDLYFAQLRRELYRGFDSWWCDSTEPFSAPDWQGSVRLPEERRFELVGGEHVRCLGALRANLYALEHARGIFEHERAEQAAGTGPVRRVLNLTRSGYPGSQRYGAVLWSGDMSATWASLRAEITKAISMGLCGMPWWTTDAGAFFAGGTTSWRVWCDDPDAAPVWFWHGDYDGGVADPGYRELYTRWLQLGCLLPMFRSHGTDTPREIWNFGAPGESFYDAVAAAIRLRYRLLPYIYTAAAQATLADDVMVRGLLFDFLDDPDARVVDDQYMFGEALLVCPVTQSGATTRRCYLPSGTDWWDFWTGERLEGGRTVDVEAPLDRIPLFVRAGAVVVQQAAVDHALENRDRFDVVVHPGADGGGRLYDDDGLTYTYEQGDYSLVEFTWHDAEARLDISAASWARTRPMEFTVRLAGSSTVVTFDGDPTSLRLAEQP